MSENYIIPTPGDVVAGKYFIERELGRGAYGVVFQARQEGIDRAVALKTLLPKAFLDDEVVARFEREAQFVGRLSHPNIVGVHDYGRYENLLYMAVEYVEGDNLDEIIARDGPLEPSRVRPLVYQMIDALEHAHERGIVHRDLKPANIVVVDRINPDTGQHEDIVKVLDFGIAKLIRAEADDDLQNTLTQDGSVLGTPHYMSPESIIGDHVDARSDVYSLGVIIYEMLTGERPFGANNSPGVMVKHLRDQPPALPAPLDASCWGAAVDGCLRKKPENRLQNISEVHQILERRDEQAAAARAAAGCGLAHPGTSQPAASPKPALAAVAVGVVLAFAIAATVFWQPSFWPGSTPVRPTPAPADGNPGDRQHSNEGMAPGAPDGPAATDRPTAAKPAGSADPADTRSASTSIRPPPADPASPTDASTAADRTGAQAKSPTASGGPTATRPPTDEPATDEPAAKAPNTGHGHARSPTHAASAKPDHIQLDLRSQPPGTRVLVDQTPIGTTPVDHRLRSSNEPIDIEFSHIGYRTAFRKVVPDHDQTITMRLQKGRLKLVP